MSELMEVPCGVEERVGLMLCAIVEKLAEEAIEKRGVFHIGVSPGRMIDYLSTGLWALPNANQIRWTKWRFIMCEECYVPENDMCNSTYGTWRHGVARRIPPLSPDQCLQINYDLPFAQCVQDYQNRVLAQFGIPPDSNDIPSYDVLLLSTGPEGRVCGLYPGHALLTEDTRLFAPLYDAPYRPVKRITITFPLIRKARVAIFATSRAHTVPRPLQNFPVGWVKARTVFWITDGPVNRTLSTDSSLS